MRVFYVIVTKSSNDLYYIEQTQDKKYPNGKWSFSIYEAKKFDRYVDAEFDRLASNLRDSIVEEHVFQDKYIKN